ncbi:hypothetical protein BG006_009942 [Podila minutissima]|uniref:DH domain-containing protein n=1 Tax=Podila minutissima TaxID=64525 RepID=A0A9P5SDT9_9FUNG|nr:hypothetical protein BG006_009942 [Podila minutissima]
MVVANKLASVGLTEQQQYQAIEQTLTRAGYDHEAYIETRPKAWNGSFCYSTRGGHVVKGVTLCASVYSGAASVFGVAGLQQTQYSTYSPKFSKTSSGGSVRSGSSSIFHQTRPSKTGPPVEILPHYNSPYEGMYYEKPNEKTGTVTNGVRHWICKDLRIGTVCISYKPGDGGTAHFLVRTVLKFVNIDLPGSIFLSPGFDQCRRSYYSLTKKGCEMMPMLHFALQQCLESIPEAEVNRHQVVRHQSAVDHSVFVLDQPGWMQNPGYIASLVHALEEIKQDGFTTKPAALTEDIVIPETEIFTATEKQKFWTFFRGLGEPVDIEPYKIQRSSKKDNLPKFKPGDKDEEYLNAAINELINTEIRYCERMSTLTNLYYDEAKAYRGLVPIAGKYEIRIIFSNIKDIASASTAFVKDLKAYERGKSNLGEISKRNLKAMHCYKAYLLGYAKSRSMLTSQTRRNVHFAKFLEKCRELTENPLTMEIGNLLIEPTQRIAKYPLLFKEIVSALPPGSSEIDGLKEAAEIAADVSHMESGKPELNAETLFRIRSTVVNCPDSLISQSRVMYAFLDGHETNLLSGERGKSITVILFSDKVMIVRRPRNATGDQLFGGDKSSDSMGFLNRQQWKFMGWMDLAKLKISCVEQTDPEGLFCLTTRNHSESKDDLWETTRGILPECLDKRDNFISKFYEVLSIAKASSVGFKAESTATFHVGELELFCNVFKESAYRDFKHKGEVSLFYSYGLNHPVDVTPFTRLPLFVGMIQSSDSGFRAVLRSKANLNDSGDPIAAAEDVNSFLAMEAFQVHVTELVSNLQWTVYHFDPYQSAQLHFSRLYMDSDYFYKTAAPYLKATHRRSFFRSNDSPAPTTASPTSRSSGTPTTTGQGYSGSFTPLGSPSSGGILSLPGSPSGNMVSRLIQAANNNNNNNSSSSSSSINYSNSNSNYSNYNGGFHFSTMNLTNMNHNLQYNNSIHYNSNNNGSMSPLGGMAMAKSPSVPNHQHSFSMQPSSVPPLHQISQRQRRDSTAGAMTTTTSALEPLDYGSYQGMVGGQYTMPPLAVDTMRLSIAAMNTLVPRKKAPSSMHFGPGMLVP